MIWYSQMINIQKSASFKTFTVFIYDWAVCEHEDESVWMKKNRDIKVAYAGF